MWGIDPTATTGRGRLFPASPLPASTGGGTSNQLGCGTLSGFGEELFAYPGWRGKAADPGLLLLNAFGVAETRLPKNVTVRHYVIDPRTGAILAKRYEQ